MAVTRIVFPEFRDEQGDSRYPFSDTATLTADSGQQIPKDAFLDASLYVIGSAAPFYVSEIVVDNELLIKIGAVGNTYVAYAKYNPFLQPTNTAISVYDLQDRPAGIIVIKPDSLANIAGWGPGSHLFAPQATEFVSSAVIPAQEPGVRALAVSDLNTFITGDVWLVGKQGVTLRQVDAHTIRVDITGVPLFKRAQCAADGNENTKFTPASFLRTINGCGPDEFGNFTITAVPKSAADTTLRIYPDGGLLKIGVVGKKVIQ